MIHGERKWPREIVKRLELIAQMFANAIRAQETR